MDLGPADSKRPRLASWSGATSQPTSLPHPHQHPLPHSHSASHLPHPAHPQLPAAAPYHQSYPPRHSDIAPVHTAPAPPHGHSLQHPDVDRRHQDQEPLAPMQDHYRHQHQQQPQPHPQQQQHHQIPPQSPVQPHYPYPSRDSLVKREGHDDTRRSNAQGHLQDGSHGSLTSNIPHTHPGHPPPYPPENQRHVSYESGQQPPSTPGGFRPHPAPPTPISQQPAYEIPSSYPPSDSPHYSSSHTKKKNTRASQACDQCRQLKAKCDETKPCKTCRDKGTECRYRDPVPKATDKAQSDILDGISMMQNTLVTLTEHFQKMDERLTKIESSVGRGATGTSLKQEAVEEAQHDRGAGSPDAAADSTVYGLRDGFGAAQEHTTLPEDEMEMEPGPLVPPGEPAIPMNHTTLAGLLLNWPSIRELTKTHVERAGIRYVGEYPISQEQNRGLLILYGRGEDSHFARQQREPMDHGTLEMGDDSSDMASPSPAADWGYLGGLSPHDQFEYRGGVLGIDGNPDFSEAKVWSYVESFKEHILNMHPIIQPHILTEWVRHFLDTLPTTQARQAKQQQSKVAFAVSTSTSTLTENTGAKRKRSPAPDAESQAMSPPARSGKPCRTINTALILTILALGKVCQHRDGVPDALHHGDPLQHGSPLVRNGVLGSPKQGSPPTLSSRSVSASLPSPREQDKSFQSRRSSTQGTSRPGFGMKKNYESIPGLEYFAFATDILGNQIGSYNNMKNVYANIFAGLYQGQLGRPLESFAFIHHAGHKLQVIMRPSLDKMRKIKQKAEFIQETKYNQLALAFWTCLQLESDLIAELSVPPSGLLSYENDMPHPNMSLLKGFSKPILDSYLGQLYLRTHLNSIHRMFYSPDDPSKLDRESRYKNVGVVADAVSSMQWVGPSFAFNEHDPPAGDLLSARLRAKYWGAQNITFRPFIRQILHFSAANSHPAEVEPPISEFRAEIDVPRIQPDDKVPSDLDPSLIEFAKKGIKALIESTRAFHGLGDKRPIITNVFGTAHAQWGNLLVLAAVFKDPILHEFIDEDLLRGLFQRTIAFLRQSATATSSLRLDMQILEGLQFDLFGVTEMKPNTSFTSHSTSQTPKLAAGSTAMLPPGSGEGDVTPQMSHGALPPQA